MNFAPKRTLILIAAISLVTVGCAKKKVAATPPPPPAPAVAHATTTKPTTTPPARCCHAATGDYHAGIALSKCRDPRPHRRASGRIEDAYFDYDKAPFARMR